MTILELAIYNGLNPQWKASTAGGEYHSACPICGGKDRFFIQPHKQMANCSGYYCCRQCGINGDAIQFAREFLNYSFQDAAQIVNATITDKKPLFLQPLTLRPIILKEPSKQWISNATKYVEQAHNALLARKEILLYLNNRGIPLTTIKKYKFGWASRDQFFSRND